MIEDIKDSWLFWVGLVFGYFFFIGIYVEIFSRRFGLILSIIMFLVLTLIVASLAMLVEL